MIFLKEPNHNFNFSLPRNNQGRTNFCNLIKIKCQHTQAKHIDIAKNLLYQWITYLCDQIQKNIVMKTNGYSIKSCGSIQQTHKKVERKVNK